MELAHFCTDLSLNNPGCFMMMMLWCFKGSCKAHPGLLRMASLDKVHGPRPFLLREVGATVSVAIDYEDEFEI